MEPLWTVEELLRELDQPNLTGWKLFAQTSDVNVYRRIDPDNVKISQLISDHFFCPYRKYDINVFHIFLI